jgi:hypothetical protein
VTAHLTHRNRLLATLAAAVALIAVTLLTAAPRASAYDNPGDLHCHDIDNGTFNACLRLEGLPFRWWNAHVSIDVFMPEQYAREIVACDADFRAVLFGDDGGGSSDDNLRTLWDDAGYPIATSYGISAQLTAQTISDDSLNEDDGVDELYARVSYFDCHTGIRRFSRTGTIVGYFGSI